MARPLRVEYAGAVYHVMARGNNRQAIYLAEDDFAFYLHTLGESVEQTGWRVHAYVLMRNHYHLLLETPEPNLVAGMKWLQQTYTQRFNARHKRSGHLFQGRYKSIPVDAEETESVQRISAYIHLNPFRAGLCEGPHGVELAAYRWSSYPGYLSPASQRPTWLETERVLASMGLADCPRDRRRYRLLMEERMAYERAAENAAGVKAAYKDLRRGWYVGNAEFGEWLLERLTGHEEQLTGEQRRDHGEAEAERLLRRGLTVLGFSLEDVMMWPSVDVRKQSLAWLLKTRTTVGMAWIADRLCLGHRSNASRAVSRFRTSQGREERKWRRKMSQCTG
jgi:REP element-mobilizing transposase RayT